MGVKKMFSRSTGTLFNLYTVQQFTVCIAFCSKFVWQTSSFLFPLFQTKGKQHYMCPWFVKLFVKILYWCALTKSNNCKMAIHAVWSGWNFVSGMRPRDAVSLAKTSSWDGENCPGAVSSRLKKLPCWEVQIRRKWISKLYLTIKATWHNIHFSFGISAKRVFPSACLKIVWVLCLTSLSSAGTIQQPKQTQNDLTSEAKLCTVQGPLKMTASHPAAMSR